MLFTEKKKILNCISYMILKKKKGEKFQLAQFKLTKICLLQIIALRENLLLHRNYFEIPMWKHLSIGKYADDEWARITWFRLVNSMKNIVHESVFNRTHTSNFRAIWCCRPKITFSYPLLLHLKTISTRQNFFKNRSKPKISLNVFRFFDLWNHEFKFFFYQ